MMKKQAFTTRFSPRQFIWILAILSISFGSCKAIREIAESLTNVGNDTNQILDQAINDLNANAGNYAQILEKAIGKVDSESIKAQLKNALDDAIVTASTEIRCDIQFTADFLVKRIRGIKARITNSPAPIEDPRICTTFPSEIKMSLPVNQRTVVNITGYFLNEDFGKFKLFHVDNRGRRTNRTSSLSLSSDFKLIVNLGRNGITLNQASDKLVLMWDNTVVTEVPVIQKQLEPCVVKTRNLGNLPTMTMTPRHKKNPWNNKKGDKEFDGNGPCSRGSVAIFTRNNGTELWARANVQMWECPDDLSKIRSDYTYGDVRREQKLVTVEPGFRIKRINTPTNSSFENIDKKTNTTENVSGNGPVSIYKVHGDTSGSDIGASRVVISFRAINVVLEEIGDCVRS